MKRAVEPDGSIDEMRREDMVLATTARVRQGDYVVTVLDAYGDIATVKVLSTDYVDHVQLARFGERWQLLNVLWQPRVRLIASKGCDHGLNRTDCPTGSPRYKPKRGARSPNTAAAPLTRATSRRPRPVDGSATAACLSSATKQRLSIVLEEAA